MQSMYVPMQSMQSMQSMYVPMGRSHGCTYVSSTESALTAGLVDARLRWEARQKLSASVFLTDKLPGHGLTAMYEK